MKQGNTVLSKAKTPIEKKLTMINRIRQYEHVKGEGDKFYWIEDWMNAIRNLGDEGPEGVRLSLIESEKLRNFVGSWIKNPKKTKLMKKKCFHMYGQTLLYESPYIFDSYLQYLEFDRLPSKRFYLPRRRVLKRLVDDYQDLADGKIDFLGISLPPRVGKSTLGILFVTWMMGLYPDDAIVMSGHSDKLTRGFFDETCSILQNPEYNWHDIFPGHGVVTSAKDETVDLDKKRRFSTLTCRAIGATLTGAVEAKTLLYSDDLVEDLEEALNSDRMQTKYDAYLNQLKDRKLDGCKEVMVGTRWGVNDPLGNLKEQYKDNPRYRFTVIPALNEKMESNFVYDYGLGFTTEYYLDMKASIDDATWMAKYMGDPYVREGLAFPEDALITYTDLPENDDYRIVAVNDVAWGGDDYYVLIVAYVFKEVNEKGYEEDVVYIEDVICDKSDKSITRPRVVGKLLKHLPSVTNFETNNGGHEYADNVDEDLKARGRKLNIRADASKYSVASKMTRITMYQSEIRGFKFKHSSLRDSDYNAFMGMLTRWSFSGKNKNDDAPDACAMLAKELKDGTNKFEVFKRPG